MEAKSLKEKYALAHKGNAQSADYVEVVNNNEEKIRINQFELSEIVMSRMEEILNLCKKEINYLTKKEISYIIFTGGLTECRDFNYILEEIFGNKSVDKYYKNKILELAQYGYSYVEIVEILENDQIPLSLNLTMFIKNLVTSKNESN